MKKLQLFIFLSLLSSFCFAQEKWDLKKNENGIAVYARKLTTGKFKEIRVICEVKGTEAQLYKILQNVNHHKDWVYNTKVSYLIKRKSKDTLFYYSEVSLPWPITNRDLAIRLTFERDTMNKILKVQARSTDNILPEKSGLVRVPYSLGLWNVTALPNNRIKIDYTFSVNPGGALPAWLVNSMATAGPYNTFKSLKALIERKAL